MAGWRKVQALWPNKTAVGIVQVREIAFEQCVVSDIHELVLPESCETILGPVAFSPLPFLLFPSL